MLGRKEPTGENIFLAWGYPTVLYLLVEFAALKFLHQDWAPWLWVIIPLIGAPLMMYFLHKDYERTRRKTINERIVLRMWIFIGAACGIFGCAMGFANLFGQCYFALFGFLMGIGCFMTGVIGGFQPNTVCGIIASALAVVPLFLQGDLWHWQLPVTAVIVAVALIIPGHLYRIYLRRILHNNQ